MDFLDLPENYDLSFDLEPIIFDPVPEAHWNFDPETFLSFEDFRTCNQDEPSPIQQIPTTPLATTHSDVPLSVEGSLAELLGLDPADLLERPPNPVGNALEEDSLIQISASTLQGLILLVDRLQEK